MLADENFIISPSPPTPSAHAWEQCFPQDEEWDFWLYIHVKMNGECHIETKLFCANSFEAYYMEIDRNFNLIIYALETQTTISHADAVSKANVSLSYQINFCDWCCPMHIKKKLWYLKKDIKLMSPSLRFSIEMKMPHTHIHTQIRCHDMWWEENTSINVWGRTIKVVSDTLRGRIYTLK